MFKTLKIYYAFLCTIKINLKKKGGLLKFLFGGKFRKPSFVMRERKVLASIKNYTIL